MSAEAILSLEWTNKAGLFLELTARAIGDLVRTGYQSYGSWMIKDRRLPRNDHP